jgi:hypothetical protein
MTIVIARKWGDRIVMLSDTMISDRTAARPDIIPGQLKAIVLTPKLSVAYAGRAGKALDTIRKVRGAAREGADLPDMLESLRQVTGENTEPVDFLVASHYEAPSLYKIWNGLVSPPANWYWIGDSCAADAVQRRMELQPIMKSGEWYSEEEFRLSLAFEDVVRESTFQGVGGFSFELLGSPLGHCYQNRAGSHFWGTVRSDEIDTPEFRSFEKTGTAHYQYSMTSSYRGAGVTGAFLPQIGLGFIYSPSTR